jgi:ubiquinone biosynthesis protein
MVWGVLSAVRDLPRLREISAVLIRHELGDLVRRAGIATVLERARKMPCYP